MSMGWRSGQAYSQDLRERILAAIDAGMSVREAARLFQVSISYIYKALIRRRRTGETAARSQHGHVGQKLAAYQEAIRQRVAASSISSPPTRGLFSLQETLRDARLLLRCASCQSRNNPQATTIPDPTSSATVGRSPQTR